MALNICMSTSRLFSLNVPAQSAVLFRDCEEGPLKALNIVHTMPVCPFLCSLNNHNALPNQHLMHENIKSNISALFPLSCGSVLVKKANAELRNINREQRRPT